jgi:hypothetical protein
LRAAATRCLRRRAAVPARARVADRVIGSCDRPHTHSLVIRISRLTPKLSLPADATGYRERLHRALVLASVCGLLASRFCVKSALLELVCAIAFMILELLPAVVPFGAGYSWLASSARVQGAVDTYESIVFNKWWDLNDLLPILLLAVLTLILARRCARARRRRNRKGAAIGKGGRSGDASPSGLSQIVVTKAE